MLLGRCGVAAVLGYIGLCLVSQTVAQHLFARALGPQLATVERLTMLPLPGWGPVRWRGIAVTRSAYLVSHVTLVPPRVTSPEVIAKGPDTPLVRALRTSRLVRLFWDRARFPVVEITARDAEQLVRFMDLRATGDGRHRTRWDLSYGSMRLVTCRRWSSSIAPFCQPRLTFDTARLLWGVSRARARGAHIRLFVHAAVS